MTNRRVEIADIDRVNEIICDDPKALIIKAYEKVGLFAINYYESKNARKKREAQDAQIRQYEEWKAKEQQQQPQPAQANGEVRRGPGRPPKNPVEQSISGKVEEVKSKGIFHRKDKMVQPSNRCVICGSPDANIVKFHVPGAPTEGETRFCSKHGSITDLAGISLYQVG